MSVSKQQQDGEEMGPEEDGKLYLNVPSAASLNRSISAPNPSTSERWVLKNRLWDTSLYLTNIHNLHGQTT